MCGGAASVDQSLLSPPLLPRNQRSVKFTLSIDFPLSQSPGEHEGQHVQSMRPGGRLKSLKVLHLWRDVIKAPIRLPELRKLLLRSKPLRTFNPTTVHTSSSKRSSTLAAFSKSERDRASASSTDSSIWPRLMFCIENLY